MERTSAFLNTADSGVEKVDLDRAFKALASPVRREIISMISAEAANSDKSCCGVGEICACRFSAQLDLAPSTMSHHLSQLVSAGLLTARKSGVWVYYRINGPAFTAVSNFLAGYES